jgi:hypothetical protein
MIFLTCTLRKPSFSWEMLTLFLDSKIRQLHSPGGYDIVPKNITVLRSANPVCAVLKVLRSTEIRCGVRALNNFGPHLSFLCVIILCVFLIE